MALVKCKECGNQVSSKAATCPSCGAKVPNGIGIVGWLFALLVVLPLAWQFGKGMGEVDEASPARSQTASDISGASEEPAATWTRHEYKDAMTDVGIVVVSARSKNSTQFEFPYRQPGGSRLTISFRSKGDNFDAYLRIDKGQMQCSYNSCSFNLRVGENSVQKWAGLQSTTRDSDLMFVRDAKKFEDIVKAGKPFRIGIEFYQAGERVFEFDPSGYTGI